MFIGKHFLSMCPCNLYNCPSSALPSLKCGQDNRGLTIAKTNSTISINLPASERQTLLQILMGLRNMFTKSEQTNRGAWEENKVTTTRREALRRDWLIGSDIHRGCRPTTSPGSSGCRGSWSDSRFTSLYWLKTVTFKTRVKGAADVGCKSCYEKSPAHQP